MQTLTYRFSGPAHKAPISSVDGDPIICQLHSDFIGSSVNGTPFVLATLTSRTHTGLTWTYVVSIEDNQLQAGAIALGKFTGTLHALSGPDKFIRATSVPHILSYEVFGPTEAISSVTRWVSNPDASGIITGIRVSVQSIGDGTLQLALDGTSIFPTPITLNALTQFIPLSFPIASGARLNAVTVGAVYGAARGLQVSLRIQS